MIEVFMKVSKSGIVNISITSKISIVGIIANKSSIIKKQRISARSA